MSGERESLWGAQRKRPATAPPIAEDHNVDDGASPKERHVLDLQQKAGNSAVAGAVQRSLWGDLSDWFGGGDAKGGGGAKDLGDEQPVSEKGFGDVGEKGGGFKDFGFEEPMGGK